ncbi:MAG: glycosyltransferase, partial [Frondihabitans sp.]|nr:glycosyltransferase [Frondihabitans sp.]
MRRSWPKAMRSIVRRLPGNGYELRRDLLTVVDMCCLAIRNRLTRRSVLEVTGPRVSLTTYGRRVRSVHLAIESIARGDLRPSEIVLWLDEPRAYDGPPAPIRRLMRRGLEVRLCNPIGSHAKYYPGVLSDAAAEALVTADDDVIYPREWLSSLAHAAQDHPHDLIAFRAKGVEVFAGDLRPYVTWPDLRADDK